MLARPLSRACLILACATQAACTMPARAADSRAAAPSVTSLVPNSGSTSGGTVVKVKGVNFAQGATVAFGATAATNVVFVSATQLTCVTPVHDVGAVAVTVTNPDTQNSTLANGFTYGGPLSITSVRPHIGTTNGGLTVAIAGANFANGATVTFGGAAATNVVFVSTTQLTCVTPVWLAGPAVVDVVVTNWGADSATLSSGFVYKPARAPAVAGVVPPSGTTNGGTAARIKGAYFANGARVVFGGIAATNVAFTNRFAVGTSSALPVRYFRAEVH